MFQKNPVLGKVKTRLAATVGEKEALDIYLQLLQHTYKIINELTDVETFIYFSDTLETEMDQMFVEDIHLRLQEGIDLGSRMKNAFDEVLNEGFDKALIIGTDCPEISPKIINMAFEALETTDVVFGPALDGGYYLLGIKQVISNLFENMAWSHHKVLSDSIKRLNLENQTFTLLEMLSDIDTEEDWKRFKNTISQTI
ncbi:TIGR04282 family arsenosugar biosynthesis glycosyltransferase [Belliella marina]|uniref:TIGR04282 family arsenosugar biosynthesis glycosyltransferase n=1 Tax=Belliella marina TaxID=1644146 RepID=A0ABW4VMQ8_9BACT